MQSYGSSPTKAFFVYRQLRHHQQVVEDLGLERTQRNLCHTFNWPAGAQVVNSLVRGTANRPGYDFAGFKAGKPATMGQRVFLVAWSMMANNKTRAGTDIGNCEILILIANDQNLAMTQVNHTPCPGTESSHFGNFGKSAQYGCFTILKPLVEQKYIHPGKTFIASTAKSC